jgi:hypothetical protein
VGGLEEAGFVEAGLGPLLAQLLFRMRGVLVFQLVVERPEAQGQGRALTRLEGAQAGDQLLPESGSGSLTA